MNKQQLASKIWASANKMRSKIEASEYKDFILGFIFYKFLSDKEEELLKKDGWNDNDIKNELLETDTRTVVYVQSRIGYFIEYKNLFSTWIDPSYTFSANQVTDALNAFARNIYPSHKKVFENIFNTLQTGLSKLGDTNAARTKSILDLLKLIKDIPTDDSQDYDVLGFIYEYLIGNFAASAGKKAGEFYTPHEVALLMAEIVSWHLKEKDTITIYDPTSGSGSLLINIGKAAAKHLRDRDSIKYYAQELKENTFNLTRMNLVMRGIKPENIVVRCGDTLDHDWPMFDENNPSTTYEPLYVDAVVSNPPYSQSWDNSDKEDEARYSNYGVAPKGKADFAFLLHDLFHIKPDGIMTIVLPHGVLFRGKEEAQIRKNLIERNHVDAIIGLPANIFFGTGIPTIIMVLRQKRKNTDTLFIDASRLSEKVGKRNKLTASDIRRIADTYIERNPKDTTFARVVERDEIRRNDYNLNIPRYIDSADVPEPWDIHSTVFGGIPKTEIDRYQCFWEAFPTLRDAIFENTDTPYTSVKVENVEKTICANADVQAWRKTYFDAIKTLPEEYHESMLSDILHQNKEKLREESVANLFSRVKAIKLIDKYQAYQIFAKQWEQIAIDYEIIQTEGFNATRAIDPRMVIKKKDDKEEDVQDGWMGRILPFELVQKELLTDDYNALMHKVSEVEEKQCEVTDAAATFDEEDLSDDIYDAEKESFITKGVTVKAKAIRKELHGQQPDEDSFEEKLLIFYDLCESLKKLKKEAKALDKNLLAKTMETIPALTDEQVFALLHTKWISPIVSTLEAIPEDIVSNLTQSILAQNDKYALTLMDVEKSKAETGAGLSSLIDELTGNEFDLEGFSVVKSIIEHK